MEYTLAPCPIFWDHLNTVVWHNGTECRCRGQPYTYQAQPTERVQRLSTLASAANSMQLAFSLAATLPTQGLGINAGAAASRTAVGLAEAIERTPLVIGYTDRQSLTQDADSTARFGYVFGPKAILEPEEDQLVYRQIPANHPVYADVSVPGWWPEMLLKIRTAWAGNWHQGTGILNNMQPDGGRQISLRLRPQQRATATLTGFIADGLLPSGFESTTITEVIPNPVSACAGRIEFLIKGRNLWRGSEVYLRGKRHEGLRVLPDMRGLAVTFDMNSLPRTPDHVAPTEMIVWTSFGPGRYPIEIVDTVDGQPCAGSPEATDAIALRPHLPRFVNIAMAKLRVELVTPMPAAARDEKIAVELTTTTGEMLPEVEMDIANRLLGQWFEAATLVTLPTDLDAAEFDGAALRVGVSYQLSRDGRRYFSWAPETVVFYSAANQAKFQIATDQIDGFAAPVVLRAPVRLGRAYPKFNRVEEAFSATIEEHDKIPVHVVADWSSQPGMVVLNLAKGSGGAAEDAFVTAWCANPLNIKIGLTELAGDDQPELVTTNVVLQKRPAAECPVS